MKARSLVDRDGVCVCVYVCVCVCVRVYVFIFCTTSSIINIVVHSFVLFGKILFMFVLANFVRDV